MFRNNCVSTCLDCLLFCTIFSRMFYSEQAWNTETISLRCRRKNCLEMISPSRIKVRQVCLQPIVEDKSCLSLGLISCTRCIGVTWPCYVTCGYWMSSRSKIDLSYWSYERWKKSWWTINLKQDGRTIPWQKNNSHEGTCVKFSDQKPKTLRLNF